MTSATARRVPEALRARSFAGWLATGVCVAVALLSWLGYRAISESRRSTALLIDQRTSDAADLLAMAFARDMQGVQTSVLQSANWNERMLAPPYDVTALLASAFARYPYPESFFGWSGALVADNLTFFHRAERLPAWARSAALVGRFPVSVSTRSPIAADIARRIERNARGDFSVFETAIDGVPFQVIAKLLYADPYHERVEGGLGFMVDLAWVRAAYFQELRRQLGAMGGPHEGLRVTIADERDRPVIPAAEARTIGTTARRSFPLLFVDPLVVALDRPSDLPAREWTMDVGVLEGDPTLGASSALRPSSLVTSAFAAAVLAFGLAITSRAARASAKLAEMRSDFVATVTHELKTPLATIRAVGGSVASGRIAHADKLREYGHLLVQESKRLERLVDNSLAYARVTDVAQVYHFAVLDVRELVEEALYGFAAQLKMMNFDVEMDIPRDLDPVHADRTAIGLVLDNVIDNAIRYSGESRWLRVTAAADRGRVALAVSDRGIGIPADEMPFVVRKFFRGRAAGSGGSGLGLAIVNRIVRDHGGRLDISSVVSAGTTVTLTLLVAHHPDA